MISIKTKLHISVCIIICLLIGVIGCSLNEKKIQPTTSSEKALNYFNKGQYLLERLRADEAAKYFEKAIEIDSMFAYARIFLSGTYLSQKDRLEELNRALEMTDHISEGERLFIMSEEARFNNDTEKQLELLNKILKIYPDDERIYNVIGNIYFGNQEYEKAIEMHNKVIEINPEYSQAYNQLGYSYRFLKDYESAEEMFNKYIELTPNEPNPYDSYAELLMEMGKFEESIKYYEKALSINPYFYFSRLGIANDLNFLEQHTEARNQLQLFFSTTHVDGQKQIALLDMAISYLDEGNVKGAIKMLEKRLNLNLEKNDTIAIFFDYLTLAFIYSETGVNKSARNVLDSVQLILETVTLPQVLIDNGNQFYLANSIFSYIKENNLGKAKEQLLIYNNIDLTDKNSNLIRIRNQINGAFFRAEGKYDEALEKYYQSNLLDPYNLYHIANIFEIKNEIDSALYYYNEAAYANLKSSLQYAFIRKRALNKISELSQN